MTLAQQANHNVINGRFPAVYLPFSPVYLARSGRKSSMNQPLGRFAASKRRSKTVKTVKTVATPPHRIESGFDPWPTRPRVIFRYLKRYLS